jgi:hypothetical protein
VWSGDSSWTWTDVDRLKVNAEQCPFKYGDGVFMARNLLAYMDTVLVFYQKDCELPIEPSERRGQEEGYLGTNDEIALYPNPNDGEFTFECTLGANSTRTLKISDATGRVLESWPIGQSSTTIRLHGFPSGVYLCHFLRGDEKPLVARLIILRP